jgi:hypothetical protein
VVSRSEIVLTDSWLLLQFVLDFRSAPSPSFRVFNYNR